MSSRLALITCVALLGGVAEVSAQLPQRQRQQRAPGEAAPGRTALERQVQQQLWRLTRQRVGLSDAQMRQLVPVNQRFEARRRQILREERETRLALRGAVLDSATADDSRVSTQIDRLLQLERQRIDLVQEEQRELSRFMTPLQRARYMALQEQVRRRVEQMRRREQRR